MCIHNFAEEAAVSASTDYHVNFFKPTSAHARANRNRIIFMILIWASTVFGFQLLLAFWNRPTPEPAYLTFTAQWEQMEAGTPLPHVEKQAFIRTLLHVIGKSGSLPEGDGMILKQTLSWALCDILPEANQASFRMMIAGVEEDPVNRRSVVDFAGAVLGLEPTGFDKLLANVLPGAVVPYAEETLHPDITAALPGIMERLLVHNRNPLTDFQFFGFPFHYWFTAQFTLLVFVLLCLAYARMADRDNKKYHFEED